MKLEKAIKIVKSIRNSIWFLCSSRTRRKILSEEEQEAIDTVLTTLEIKDEYLQLIYDILIDYDGCNTVESLKELIDEVRQYVKQAFTNDDKSVIYTNWSKGNIIKQNILGEEVE